MTVRSTLSSLCPTQCLACCSLHICCYIGNFMPSIAFGTWGIGNGQGPIDQVEQAISVGFSHIGTIISLSLSGGHAGHADTVTCRHRPDVPQRGGGWKSRAGERAPEGGYIHHYQVFGTWWTRYRNFHHKQPQECASPSYSLPP
jgi:hypothetical protein